MSQKKHNPNHKPPTDINDPKAAVLDYSQLKITIQSRTSHHLPTLNELHKVFQIYGNCTVENIGKSNQYRIKYKIANSGFTASTALQQRNTNGTNGTISIAGGKWSISSIKYQWNNYCSSIFHSNNSPHSICSKGSKCTQIHNIAKSDCAFIPSGNKATDNLSWERLKHLRWKLYRENNTVEDIEDWNTMEGISSNTFINKNKKKNIQPYDSSTSSDSSGTSDSEMNARPSPNNMRKTKQLAQKKAQIALALKSQIKNGNANRKFSAVMHKKENKQNIGAKPRRMRKSPPLKPIYNDNNKNECDNKSVCSNRSNKSSVSYRSARSTVYICKPQNISVNDSTSDSDSSSFSDSENMMNNKNKKVNICEDWNKLNDEISKDNKKENNKQKKDAIAMRYLKHKRNNNSGVRSKRNSNSKVLVIPKDVKNDSKARGSIRKVNKNVREGQGQPNNNQKKNGKINENNNQKEVISDTSSITSAEKIAVQSVANVIGSNGTGSPLSRVPIIDPNKHTVQYIGNKNNSPIISRNNSNKNKPKPQAPTRKPPPPSPIPVPSPINKPNNNIMRHGLSSMPNAMISPINGINMNGIINAPPYYPTTVPNVFNSIPNQPPASVPNFMNSMPMASIGTGNILAGTFKASIPQQQSFVPPIYGHNNTSPIIQRNNNNNNNANNIPSIPTISVNSNHKPRPKQRPKPRPRPKPVVNDSEDKKFKFTYDTTRPSPSTEEDYHWLCYHFRSGQSTSCTYGNECKWRHYDFDERSDISTSWDPKYINPRDRPRQKQLAEARVLKRDLESKFKWLTDKQYSNNIFINNNQTPPDTKKQRIVNHKRNSNNNSSKKKLFMDDGNEQKINEECEEMDNEVVNAEMDNENEMENESGNAVKQNESNVKDNILRDFDTALSIMAPFTVPEQEKNSLDYYLIGTLAYQQLIKLRKKITDEL